MAGLEDARRAYAEELRFVADVQSETLIEAFASVPRERFLGPGPWQVMNEMTMSMRETAEARDLYHNVLVSIDASKTLNNGSPALWARLLDLMRPARGERIAHVGTGTGYYSAILAELVGADGHLVAIEVEPELARRTAENLADRANADVIEGDGTVVDPGPVDGFVISAGATHPVSLWLDRLEPGARLLLPLTVDTPVLGFGGVLLATRLDGGYAARFVNRVGIYPCHGARDPECNERLQKAFARGLDAVLAVRSLRRDSHEETDTCWLHGDGFCLSTREVAA